MMMRALLLLFVSLTAVSAARVKRVKAGMHYKKHDPVHIVVNKVGCVWLLQQRHSGSNSSCDPSVTEPV